jgi:hypothetical protein
MGELVALSGAVAGVDSPVAALAVAGITPSPEALQTLNELTAGGLSRAQVNTLSAAVALADAGIQDQALRTSVLNEVSGLGVFFRNTDPDGFPRWPVMTALRAYGLNLSVPAGQGDAAVAQKVRQVLNDVAQQDRGVSAQQAVAAVPQPVVLRVVGLDSGGGDKSAPAAPATPVPVVTAVDKLV